MPLEMVTSLRSLAARSCVTKIAYSSAVLAPLVSIRQSATKSGPR